MFLKLFVQLSINVLLFDIDFSQLYNLVYSLNIYAHANVSYRYSCMYIVVTHYFLTIFYLCYS